MIRIGRSADNHVVLTDILVSRHHLELRQITSTGNGASWQVTSQGTNGTFLNGILLTGESVLPDGSVLQLAQGGPLLKFQIEPVTSAKKPAVSPDTCTHEGNSANNLFCIHCGQPITVQHNIRHYQVLRTLGTGRYGDDVFGLGCRR